MSNKMLEQAGEYFRMHEDWGKRVKLRKEKETELEVVGALNDLYSMTTARLPAMKTKVFQLVMDGYRRGCTTGDVCLMLGSWPTTANAHLRELRNAGLIKKIKLKKEKDRWVVSDEGFLFYHATKGDVRWFRFLNENREREQEDIVTEFINMRTDEQEDEQEIKGERWLLEWTPWEDIDYNGSVSGGTR